MRRAMPCVQEACGFRRALLAIDKGRAHAASPPGNNHDWKMRTPATRGNGESDNVAVGKFWECIYPTST